MTDIFMISKTDHKILLSILSGAGNNPMVGVTLAVAVAIEEASKA